MHQDVLSARFCGEGVPDWTIDPEGQYSHDDEFEIEILHCYSLQWLKISQSLYLARTRLIIQQVIQHLRLVLHCLSTVTMHGLYRTVKSMPGPNIT